MKKEGLKKKIKRIKWKKGVNGAVSILLAIIMSPLLSIALLLTESARYQSVVEQMDELIDLSSFSSLAEYDEYLEERFGTLAIDQEKDVQAVFDKYFNENVKNLGKNASVNSKTATGTYSLANTDVLKQQILEYSELTVATEVLTEGLNVEDMMAKLSKALGLEDIQKEMTAVNKGIEVASTTQTTIEAANDIPGLVSTYNTEYSEYQHQYEIMEKKGLELVEALKNAEQKIQEKKELQNQEIGNTEENTEEATEEQIEQEEISEDPYDDKNVKNALNNFMDEKQKCKTKLNELKIAKDNLTSKVNEFVSAATQINKKLEDYDDAVKATIEKKDNNGNKQEPIQDWMSASEEQIAEVCVNHFNDNYKEDCESDSEQIARSLSNLDDKKQVVKNEINSSSTKSNIKSRYGISNFKVDYGSIDGVINTLINSLEGETKLENQDDSVMTGMVDIVGDIVGISGLYDGALNAKLNPSVYYNPDNPALSDQMSMSSLTNLISACENAVQAFKAINPVKKILATIVAVKDFLLALAQFLGAIITWIYKVIGNFSQIFGNGSNPEDWYDSFLLFGYGVYNMPNRTNYASCAVCGGGTSVSGYSYSKIFKTAGGADNHSLSGSLNELSSIGQETGTDLMFKGAEAEYLLIGSTSELQNQCCTFFNIYMFRLLLNIIPILRNKELTTIAAPAGPFAIVVKIAALLVEAFLDTIMIVNGKDVFLFKDSIYMSFSGFIHLQRDLVGITNLTSGFQNKIKTVIKNHNGTPPDMKGMLKCSYEEHILLLLCITVSERKYMERLQNLIQMEAAAKYKGQYEFKLDNTYTYIYTDVNYTLEPMFNIDSLTKSGKFILNKQQYQGY